MSDNTSDPTIHILRELQAGVADVRKTLAELTDPRTGVKAELKAEIAELRKEMRERHDNLVAIFGGAYRDHERRITALELQNDPPRPRRR